MMDMHDERTRIDDRDNPRDDASDWLRAIEEAARADAERKCQFFCEPDHTPDNYMHL